jgi:hypothetical protein
MWCMSTTRWSTIGIVILCLAGLGVARQVNAQGRGRGAALTLPDGPGKETVQAQCTKCHALGLIANSGGFTKQGWEDLIGTMVPRRSGRARTTPNPVPTGRSGGLGCSRT